MNKKEIKIDIFFGKGGVGKTTLATSRAFYLAEKSNANVLLMTIDPSHRLKNLLGLSFDHKKISKNVALETESSNKTTIDVLLLDPKQAFNSLGIEQNEKQHYILDVLKSPFSGMTEIFSIFQIADLVNNSNYNYYIIDTAPGSHFVDFLESFKKIDSFFNSKYVELFVILNSVRRNGLKINIFSKLVQYGVKKITQLLTLVTGNEFVENFVSTIEYLFSNKNSFLKSVELNSIINSNKTTCYNVFSLDHTNELIESIDNQRFKIPPLSNFCIVFNRDISKEIDHWIPQNEIESRFKNYYIKKREIIYSKINRLNQPRLIFKESNSLTAIEQIKKLIKEWPNDLNKA